MTKPLKPVGVGASQAGQVRPRAEGVKVQKKSAQSLPGATDVADVEKQSGVDYTDRVDGRTLPKSLGSQQSPLTGLIYSGFDTLAKLYGLDGAQGAVQLQLRALGGAEPPEAAFSQDSRKATTRQFVSLGFPREDAAKLVDLLAFVVAGFTDPGAKKSHRELKIQQEIDGFRKTLAEMKKAPLDERESMLAKSGEALLGKANQVAARTSELPESALPDALKIVEQRVRSVFDIVKLVQANIQGA
ncbi:hypothetical protein L6R52_19670 [Myxococcota bacterium]|nr:hypothetical protein [Myxococcota bacterium]